VSDGHARILGGVLFAAACAPPDMATPPLDVSTSTAATSTAASTSGSATSLAGDTTALPASGSTDPTAHETAAESSTGTPPPEVDIPLAYLRADPYARLVLEIDVVGGMDPYPTTTAQIPGVLAQLVDKPGGIEVVIDDVLIPGGPEHAWTADERVALGNARFDLELPEDAIAIHVMFVDGRAAEDDETAQGVTLGHAWGNRHVMLYKERIAAGCEGLVVGDLTQVLCERTELLLLEHELGHVLGLVDFGIPMQTDHRDPDHGPHDIDPGCLMYWRYDGVDLLDAVLGELLAGEPTVQLDRACLQDLAAAQR
jgi:hypothetical protein